MRIHISHETQYRYERPAMGIVQILRLTPRNHDGQYVVSWRIEVSEDCRLDEYHDAFGNITHTFTADGPLSELSVRVNGLVETQDTVGFVRGAVERFPSSLYLRETPLTRPDAAIEAFARDAARTAGDNALNVLHTLLARIHETIAYENGQLPTTMTAAETFAFKRGVCQDLTHVFVACARTLAIPARYVAGYFHRADGVVKQSAGHAWAEAHVPEFGWISFDPANCICGTDAHVRVAIGLDRLGAAPVRGTRFGGDGETLTIAISVEQARWQVQN
jgi:transglutaminase-like putative cysteine protease